MEDGESAIVRERSIIFFCMPITFLCSHKMERETDAYDLSDSTEMYLLLTLPIEEHSC